MALRTGVTLAQGRHDQGSKSAAHNPGKGRGKRRAGETEAGRKLLDDEGCLTGEAKCQDQTTAPTIRKAREKRHGERVEGRAYE